MLKRPGACLPAREGRVPAQAILAVLRANFVAAAVTAVPAATAIVVSIITLAIAFPFEVATIPGAFEVF